MDPAVSVAAIVDHEVAVVTIFRAALDAVSADEVVVDACFEHELAELECSLLWNYCVREILKL